MLKVPAVFGTPDGRLNIFGLSALVYLQIPELQGVLTFALMEVPTAAVCGSQLWSP